MWTLEMMYSVVSSDGFHGTEMDNKLEVDEALG